MTTREKYTSDEAIGARLLAELNGLPPAVDVDAAVRRARRQRRIGLGLVAGGTATVVGVMTLGMALFMPRPAGSNAPPATGSAVMSGCTLDPTTCDSRIVDTWAQETIAGGEVSATTPPFADPDYGGDAGTTVGEQSTTVNVLGRTTGGSSDQVLGEVSVGVADSVDEKLLVELNRGEGTITKDRTSTFTVAGEEITARVLSIDRGVSYALDDLWIIPESQTHGAVTMWAWSQEGASLSPSDDSGPGWTDASAQDLASRLLTDPA